MEKNLVIVESPSKTKAIEKYLGNDYKVVSSKGHIRDLSTTGKYGFGVDLENDFKATYQTIKGKQKVVSDLKKDVKNASKIYLATDPDREGEAISWHIKDALKIDEDKYQRVVFNEITKDVVINAFKNARKIDDNLVKSQETRRILDRIIGFRLSKLMQSKIGGKSAGRVQSVALKIIVDREKEILAFVKEEYWTISSMFNLFDSKLEKYKGKKLKINNEAEAQKILDSLNEKFIVASVIKKNRNKQSRAPFITSSLQQEASTKLNFSPKKTMSIAQKLYEGIDIGKETIGLITYMRTDSIRLSDEFFSLAKKYIEDTYGKEYIGSRKVPKSAGKVQDAHEAIRPTSVLRDPESIKSHLSTDEYKLYKIIYYRALASLMKEAKVNQTSIVLDNNGYEFKTTGQSLVFDGYLKAYGEYESLTDKVLPDIKEKEEYIAKEVIKEQHFTEPVARFSEAQLIKEMESLGIGRPSTYSKTIEILTTRFYVKNIEKRLHPTEMGIEITNGLAQYFSSLINVEYTANMEKDLDDIAEGKGEQVMVLKEFYEEFEPTVQKAFDNMEKKEAEETGEKCEKCGKPLVIKTGKYGKFTACSGFPECKFIKQDKKEMVEVCDCTKCDGKLVEKTTRKGKVFYGCNNYPKCKSAVWDKPTGKACPECHEMLVTKNEKIKCSACSYEK